MKSTSIRAIKSFVQAGPSRFGVTRADKNRYVQLLRDGRTLARAAELMGTSLVTINYWRRADPIFDRQVRVCKDPRTIRKEQKYG